MLSKDHYLDLDDGEFSGTTPDDLAAMFRALGADRNCDHVLVHFHGGLVVSSR